MTAPFKAYDIRGTYPEEINSELMEKIGRAYADFVEGNNITVGFDARVSSPELFGAFTKGITLQGKNVFSFGLTSTPMSNFACCKLKTDGGAMVTASHNPAEYNGVKFTLKEAIPVAEDTGLKVIEKKVRDNDFANVEEKGKIISVDIKEDYKKHLLSLIKSFNNKLKVVVDPANGMGAQDYALVMADLPVESELLYFDIDGSFPNHDANPMLEGATDALCKKVVETGADLGIAFDGDADRVFFIDEKGNLVGSDLITALIAEEILKEKKGEILYDLRSSKVVEETIKKNGGQGSDTRVGHSFIKQAMREKNALFAGELSGHLYFKYNIDGLNTVYDSGIVGAIYVINLILRHNKPLSELVRPLMKYFQSGEINSTVGDKEEVMNMLCEEYSSGEISKLDGIKISFEDWWFNVRPSNTEPLLRLNLEANSKELMEEKRDEILEKIRK